MAIVQGILLALEAVLSILLVAIILMQKAKSEGLGLAFGSGMGESLFGSRAGNVLTRMTVTLAILFMANTLILGIIYAGGYQKSLIEKHGIPASTAIPRPAPVQPTATPGGPSAPSQRPTVPSPSVGPQPGAPVSPEVSFGPVEGNTPDTAPGGTPPVEGSIKIPAPVEGTPSTAEVELKPSPEDTAPEQPATPKAPEPADAEESEVPEPAEESQP